MCFQDVHEYPDGSLNPRMDGKEKEERQTDKNSLRGGERQRDLERWRGKEEKVQI